MDLPSLLSCKRQINYLSLSRIGLQLSCTREAIKRESGESPEQSRCCKFIFWLRGKSDESNEPDNPSIISFTILIQRKCVLINKLCQVYYDVRSK